MKTTENLGLPLFEAEDPIRRTDFNRAIEMIDQAVFSAVPSGTILIWSGATNQIPSGYTLCDGTKGTPDLRGRFVLGSSSSYAVGAKGGEATHTLTYSEMPSHSHSLTVATFNSLSGYPLCPNSPAGENLKTYSTASAGSGAAHNNMPPYYALCYIMKL